MTARNDAMRSSARDQGSERYPATLRGLHWLVVALLVAQFAIAWTMPDVHRGTAPTGLIAWHLSVGIVIWAVMAVRLAFRLSSRIPPPPTDLPPGLRLLSRATHYAFYAILLVLPLLGYINASARGWTVRLFGVLPLPRLVGTGSAWGHTMGDVHKAVATLLLAVIALHVSGALYHLMVLKDGVCAADRAELSRYVACAEF